MTVKDVENWVEQNAMDYILGPLKNLISYYSASAIHENAAENSRRKRGLENASGHIVAELQSLGFENARLADAGDANPFIVGDYHAGDQYPTILFYGHYDVQGIDDPESWRHDPFTLTLEDGKMVARGISDDKGQMGPHFLAWKYFRDQYGKLPCNIKILIEGDEESGKENANHMTPVDEYVMTHQKELACHAVMISDTSTPLVGVPAITISTKGILKANATAKKVEDLIEFIHRSHDWQSNRVNYPGFYDGLTMPQTDPMLEKKLLDAFAEEEGLSVILRPETGMNPIQHANFRPTHDPLYIYYTNFASSGEGLTLKLTANGPKNKGTLHSGLFGGPVLNPGLMLSHTLALLKENGIDFEIDYISYGSSTGDTKIYPQGTAQITITGADKSLGNIANLLDQIYVKAGFGDYRERLLQVEEVAKRDAFKASMKESGPIAVLSHRLVGGQDPATVYASMEKFASNEKYGIELSLIMGANAYLSDTGNPFHEAVKKGMKRGYKKRTVLEAGLGGSIPVADAFSRYLNAPVIFAGFAEPGERIHDSNEELRVDVFYAATRSMIHAYQNIGHLKLK